MSAGAMPPSGGAGGGGYGSDGGLSELPAGDDHEDEHERDAMAALFVRVRDRLVPRTRNVVGYVDHGTAMTRAAERSRAIQRFDGGRFFEVPPPFRRRWEPRSGDARSDSALESILCAHQLAAPELLLLARAGDAVESLVGVASDGEKELFARVVERTQPIVLLCPLPRLLRVLRPRLYPWRIVVQTTDADALAGGLSRLGDWLGVGVDVVRGTRMSRHGACRVGGGEDGTVGGTLVDDAGERFAMTCAHVLAPACASVAWRAGLTGVGDPPVASEPDVALLRIRNCFQHDTAAAEPVGAARFADLMQVVASDLPIIHTGPSGGGGTIVHMPAEAALGAPAASLYPNPNGRGLCRFPATMISPRPWRSRLLRWPPWPRPFSRPGDSGSWAIVRKTRLWVGLVVGGTEGGSTIALQPDPLVSYLESELRMRLGGFACSMPS